MIFKYPEIGVCGLSCRLCPRYQSEGESRCFGCKTESRMRAGCPFITYAVKKKGIEFCWDCEVGAICEKWKKHMESGKLHDSFKCYRKLEEDISFVLKNGVYAFERSQKQKEELLKQMLQEFNEGRSKNYYCIAATVLETDELKKALDEARDDAGEMGVKGRSKKLHSILDKIAAQRGYHLRLRK